MLKRNWLWWVIYSYEKHLALSSSRPSLIDDDNMSARIPTAIPFNSTIQLESLSISHRHAKLHSQISRQLLSIKALSMSTNELITSVNRFHAQLKILLEEVPLEFKIGTLARPPHTTRRLIQILYLHFSIYGSLMAVHAHFFYPWMTSRLVDGKDDATVEAQTVSSSSAVAEAARKIILALRLINANVTTPSWLAFDYPVHAVVNLFLYILKYPTLPTASADLGLLDVCAGHFGYVEYLTASRVSISLPRDAANIASKVVRAAKAKAQESTSAEALNRDHNQNYYPEMQNLVVGSINFTDLDQDLTFLNQVRKPIVAESTTMFGIRLLTSFTTRSTNRRIWSRLTGVYYLHLTWSAQIFLTLSTFDLSSFRRFVTAVRRTEICQGSSGFGASEFRNFGLSGNSLNSSAGLTSRLCPSCLIFRYDDAILGQRRTEA